MAEAQKPLLIKRYASRRLYNTETSDYVTLEDVAQFVRAGREVQIVDLKSGDDLTRQYLLQIVAEHESKGDTVLPTNVLTDLVRSYTTNMQSVVPQFLAASFEMLRDGQVKVIENMNAIPNPMTAMPGFDLMRKQQEAFMKTMMGGVPGWAGSAASEAGASAAGSSATGSSATGASAVEAKPQEDAAAELAEIKKQFAALQDKLSKL